VIAPEPTRTTLGLHSQPQHKRCQLVKVARHSLSFRCEVYSFVYNREQRQDPASTIPEFQSIQIVEGCRASEQLPFVRAGSELLVYSPVKALE